MNINLEKIIKYTLLTYIVYKILYLLDLLVQAATRNADILQKLLELFARSRWLR